MVLPESEKGYAHGSQGFWADLSDEETPELMWPHNIGVLDKMRRQDAQVVSVLRAMTLPIRRTKWRVDPNGARPEVARQVADDLGLPLVGEDEAPVLRTRDRFSWQEHLRLALLMLAFGHSVFEQVYRIDEKGLARLRKLGWRPPKTISRIDVAPDGGLTAIYQHGGPATDNKDTRMGVERLVVYVNDREGGNWLGQSLLRPAYKFWLFKDRALRVQLQTLERNGMGIPIYEASKPDESTTGDDRIKQMKDEVKAGLEIVKGLRSGSNAGAAGPNGAKIRLAGVEGTLPDADVPIRYFDEQIARSVLAHFLNLGTETGSWALGSTFEDFFTLSLQTVALQIADVTTQHVIEDMVDVNWGSDEPAPKLVFDEIGSKHPATAEAIKAMLDAGAITADEALETHLRTVYGLPSSDPETRREPRTPVIQPPAPPEQRPPNQRR